MKVTIIMVILWPECLNLPATTNFYRILYRHDRGKFCYFFNAKHCFQSIHNIADPILQTSYPFPFHSILIPIPLHSVKQCVTALHNAYHTYCNIRIMVHDAYQCIYYISYYTRIVMAVFLFYLKFIFQMQSNGAQEIFSFSRVVSRISIKMSKHKSKSRGQAEINRLNLKCSYIFTITMYVVQVPLVIYGFIHKISPTDPIAQQSTQNT